MYLFVEGVVFVVYGQYDLFVDERIVEIAENFHDLVCLIVDFEKRSLFVVLQLVRCDGDTGGMVVSDIEDAPDAVLDTYIRDTVAFGASDDFNDFRRRRAAPPQAALYDGEVALFCAAEIGFGDEQITDVGSEYLQIGAFAVLAECDSAGTVFRGQTVDAVILDDQPACEPGVDLWTFVVGDILPVKSECQFDQK